MTLFRLAPILLAANLCFPARLFSQQVEVRNAAYPPAGERELYSPSKGAHWYRPVTIHYNKKQKELEGFDNYWKSDKARLVHYLDGYTPEAICDEQYNALTNKWGSSLKMERKSATGHWRTLKIDGRWWVVDPDGYLSYIRGVNSFRQGKSERNKTSFKERFNGDEQVWVEISRKELAGTGFHSVGAFSSESPVVRYNRSHPDTPLTICAFFKFLEAFKQQNGLPWPCGSKSYSTGLVFNEGWPKWCQAYIKGKAFDRYRKDPSCIGFFSDNEINFNHGSKVNLLKDFLNISDHKDAAYKGAAEFMADKGLPADATKVTAALSNEFAGLVARKYYQAIREARDEGAPGLMYMGSRLYSSSQFNEWVIKAAGDNCDIVSINYYHRWCPNDFQRYIKKDTYDHVTDFWDWEKWTDAPIMATEFYTKGVDDSDLSNNSGAGWCVHTQHDRALAYQHLTLGLLEQKNCVGWLWFKYQDDDFGEYKEPSNKGLYDNYYNMFPILGKYMREVNFNVYDLIRYFDGTGSPSASGNN